MADTKKTALRADVQIFPLEVYSEKPSESVKKGFLSDLFSNNEKIVDTSGFVPLTVRIKQMQLSGAIHAINSDVNRNTFLHNLKNRKHQNLLHE